MSTELDPDDESSVDFELPIASSLFERYPKTLQPDGEQLLQLDGVTYAVPQTTLNFNQWTGLPIKSTFGGKGLIDFEGIPIFAELVIQRMAVAAGWSARWVESFAAARMSPRLMTGWENNASIGGQENIPIGNAEIEKTLERIAERNGNAYTGCWDVLLWHEHRIIFVELKRTRRDQIRETQCRWLKAGLEVGHTIDNFLIAQWDFSPSSQVHNEVLNDLPGSE